MDSGVLLAQMKALLERAPDFNQYTPYSKEHLLWLGQAHALIYRWNPVEGTAFQNAADFLPMELIRDNNIAKILGIVHRAIADLELDVPDVEQSVFAAGEVYDIFRALNKVINSAENEIYIVDPYLDSTVFNHYLTARQSSVKVKLLLKERAEQLIPAAQKYVSQYGGVLQVRKSNGIHDRIIFIDGFVCWALGQSLKDAAKAKPTYLVPLSPDVVATKLSEYESIWSSAETLV
ncbi:MAG: hypothetical protein CMP91_01800 [Gammaproteobacteria bacterium]|nr:hypothetical protein [Gammaproteobacteria bacterium]|tara:strand:+ start:35475 stop:36176 length:702 start_codon:yes stop_codon:yes gene_type:complete